MNRLLTVHNAMLALIQAQEGMLPQRDESLDWERIHMVGSARMAWLMAEEWGEDPALAACACAVHDIGRVITGQQAGHAEAGVSAARDLLSSLNCFTPAELEKILQAVANHSKKAIQGTPLEEIVKDADVVDSHLYGHPFVSPAHRERYERWSHRHAL